jgi:hypothetical protein
MQDANRPAHIQALPEPTSGQRPCVEAKPLRLVLSQENIDRIGGHGGWWGNFGQEPTVGPPELERPVGVPRDLVRLLVHCTMMPATEKREVRQRRWPALRPVTEVMSLGDAHTAARKATASISVVKRPPQCGGNRPGPRPDLQQASIFVVAHDDSTGVTRQASGRFRGNVRAILQDRLAWLIGVSQRWSLDMDHDLVALAGGAGIETVVQGRLREQGQRVSLLLSESRGIVHRIGRWGGRRVGASLLAQFLACRRERLHEEHPHLWLETASNHHHAVLVLVYMQRAALVLAPRFPRLGQPHGFFELRHSGRYSLMTP